MNTENKKEMTVDVTPTWEATMRILVECIIANPENCQNAKDEIIRGGKILDQLIAEREQRNESD
ncbi:MAG TPA: hypothetical protein DCS48_02395 [Desulfovibrio sp.]|nr:hypothetical protein [Desulfovibrio sp.]